MAPAFLSGPRPDLTPAQLAGVLVGGVPVIANLLRAFGVYDVSPEEQQALQETMTWGGVMAGLLFASDAGLRAARNAADAKREVAGVTVAPELGDPEVDAISDDALPGDEEELGHLQPAPGFA